MSTQTKESHAAGWFFLIMLFVVIFAANVAFFGLFGAVSGFIVVGILATIEHNCKQQR